MKSRRLSRPALSVLFVAGALLALPGAAFARHQGPAPPAPEPVYGTCHAQGQRSAGRTHGRRHTRSHQGYRGTSTAPAVPDHRLAEFPFEQRRSRLSDGRFVQRYRNGQVAVQGRIVGGRPHGTWIRYFANGMRAEVRVYDRGVPTGTWMAFHANGRHAWEVSYVNGRRHGTFTAWHANGRMAEQQRYRYGRAVGPRLVWAPNGRPMRRA